MTKQAIQLGFLPRMHIVHTSAREIGQIYLPSINWILLVSVVAAVIGFGSSTNLASAYGIAVTGTMLITTVLTFWVVRYGWGYNWLLCVLATGFFLLIDLAFFSANTLKIAQGGWFPLVIGAGVFVGDGDLEARARDPAREASKPGDSTRALSEVGGERRRLPACRVPRCS